MPGCAAGAWRRLGMAMNTDKRRSLHTPPDPDDTAEMPGLQPAESSTDTWAMPPVPSATALDDVLRSHQEEMDGLRANLAALTASRRQLETGLAGATTNLRELEQRLRTREEQLRLGESERDELRSRLQHAQSELAGLAEQRAQQSASSAVAGDEHLPRDLAMTHSRADLAELQRRVAKHQEALQHAEGRRYIFDSMLREREQLADELAAQLVTQREQQRGLEDRLAQQERQAQARAQAQDAGGAAAAARAGELESQLRELREELATAQATALASQRRVVSLEAEAADHATVAHALREQRHAAEAASDTLRGDLVAAEDLIRSREAELQQRDARLARLEASEAMSEPVGAAEAWLLVRTEGDSGIAHLLGRRTTVGRTPDNELQIDADFISRHHAVVLTGEGGAIVEDLNSTNGVFVNNVRVTRRQLHAGDLVTFGKTTFRYLRKPVP